MQKIVNKTVEDCDASQEVQIYIQLGELLRQLYHVIHSSEPVDSTANARGMNERVVATESVDTSTVVARTTNRIQRIDKSFELFEKVGYRSASSNNSQ